MSPALWLTLVAAVTLGVPATEPALDEHAAEALVEGLGYHADELPVGRHVLTGIRVEQRTIEFELVTPDRSGRARLVGVHPGAAAPSDELAQVQITASLALYAEYPVAADLHETARALAARLPTVPWITPDEGPPFMAIAIVTATRWLAPLSFWSALLLAGVVSHRALRASPRRGRWYALGALAMGAALLRVGLALPWPISFVEVERVLPMPSCAFGYYAEALRPLAFAAHDPLAAQSLANLALSVLAVVLSALLGEVWLGSRLGWLAGVFAALLPLPILFSRTSTVEVALAALLPLAVLVTEIALGSRSRLAGAAAGLAWAVVVQLRPESVGLALVPAVLVLVDVRGRRWLAELRRSLPVAGMVALGVSAALLRSVLCTGGAALSAATREVTERPVTVLLANAWDLVVDPRWHDLPLLALAIGGLVLVRGSWRVVAALLAFVLPVLLFSLKGRAIGDLAFDVTDLRYVLPGLPFLAVAAAAPLVRAAELAPGAGRWLAGGVAGALALGVAVSPLARSTEFSAPAPLQAEHEFLSRVVDRVPEGAVVLVFDTGGANGEDSCPQLDYRFSVLAADRGSRARIHVVDPQAAERLPPQTDLYYVRGWFELRSAGDAELTAFRDHVAARFDVESMVEEKVAVSVNEAAVGGRVLDLGLYRLRRKVPVTP